ncbi:MAG: discoidin domain-containing protein [Phycisphaerae bacterium]|nr:discoidin domain-containing protein [Phycisphaerae bacterium]
MMKKASVLTAMCLVLVATGAAVAVPYNVDSHTLHLYHFDGDGKDSVTVNPINLVLDSGATATDAKIPGLRQALYTYEGTNRLNVNLPSAMATPEAAIKNFVGADGAFTFEALVCPAFGHGAIPNNMQIISGEHDTARGWQFRVTTASELAFVKITGTIQTIAAPLPAAGPHALAANKWFHAAVTYNGQADTEGNLKLYWTALDSGVCEPVLLGSFRLTADLDPAVAPNFVIGNEGRNNNGRTENWEGWIDEARISDIARSPSEMMICLEAAGTAANPKPADKATDVPVDTILSWTAAADAKTHDVYLGTTQADVDAASRAQPGSVLVSLGQDANTYDPPASLKLGQTYYWRIDEVQASSTVVKGRVWSFTAEPVSYPLTSLTATASGASIGMGPEKTIDGSGLNANDEHATDPTQMWLTGKTGAQSVWIQYAFEKVYRLDKLWVWNSNQVMESMLGFGAKNVTVEYSTDGTTWAKLGDFVFAQASSAATYAANTTVNFAGATAKHVKLTINSNWGGLVPQYGLSEVRFFYVPTQARQPVPATGATGVSVEALLSWRSGREAVSHQLYLGTDQQAVTDGTAPVSMPGQNHFDPGSLEFGRTYYWKIVEVNEAATPKVWEGDLWSFTTQEYAVVDDFESYNDDDNRIYDSWIDGLTDPAKGGSQVGYNVAPFAERTIIHGGKRSMPFEYNNVNSPFYSEAQREFSSVQNWTGNGADSLSLWAQGLPANSPADLYVTVQDSAGKTATATNPTAVTTSAWTQWKIPLSSLAGVNLSKVKKLSLGVGNRANPAKGGAGMLYLDDIGYGRSLP